MKAFAPCAAALVLGFQLPAQAHTAVQKWIESDLAKFNDYVHCHKVYVIEYTKAIGCEFYGGKHWDTMTVYCEDTEDFFQYVDSEGKKR